MEPENVAAANVRFGWKADVGSMALLRSVWHLSAMTQHQITPILPCNNIEESQAFYERLGFAVTGGDPGFRIMADGQGWQIILRPAEAGWVLPDRNSHGIFLFCDDVDAVADRVRDIIIEKGAPHRKPWGTYEFAVGDPDGVLVRIGRPAREDESPSALS